MVWTVRVYAAYVCVHSCVTDILLYTDTEGSLYFKNRIRVAV